MFGAKSNNRDAVEHLLEKIGIISSTRELFSNKGLNNKLALEKIAICSDKRAESSNKLRNLVVLLEKEIWP